MLHRMKTHTLQLAAVALAACALAAAADFKLYPGAVQYTPPDTEQTREFTSALRPGTTITAYFTHDSFDKVVAFYKSFAREYTNPRMMPGKLPNGEEVRKTFLILDDAPDVAKSTSWVSIQHPFIGAVSMKGGAPQYSDVRDVTEIVFTEKKPIPEKK
jgi:hypothetical protein